jgi:ankyrin repeat protein
MATVSDERIQPALHALLGGDTDGLRAALAADPELINAVWNDNTLLEWATQPPHGIDPACIDALIDAGASLDRALGLAGCWNLADLCSRLLEAGADPTSLCDETSPITPLESAAMHGSTRSADVLIEHGLHRPTLWLAAATGQLDLVTNWISSAGDLLMPPGPYRPIWAHVGRPQARPPADDHDQILGEAITFAALNDRTDVVDHLLDIGVPIDAAPYRGITSLHFAVQYAKPNMVEHLVARGASLEARDDEWNATPARWAEVCNDDSADRTAILETLT